MTDKEIQLTQEPSSATSTATPSNPLEAEIEVLRATKTTSEVLGTILKIQPLVKALVKLIKQMVDYQNCIVFIPDEEGVSLKYSASHKKLADSEKQSQLKNTFINLFNAEEDPVISQWLLGHAATLKDTTADQPHKPSRIADLLKLFETNQLESFPLYTNDNLIGTFFIQPDGNSQLSQQQKNILNAISNSAAIALENAIQHSRIVQQLADNMRDMNIMQQIDSELKDTIDLNKVFKMALDWALRFTNAHAAALALYDENQDTLRVMEHYGYSPDSEVLPIISQEHRGGITHRVARNGQSEVIPDISVDPEYMTIATTVRSQMSVPIIRENRVIAVMTLESNKLNGFDDGHLDFVEVLAQRAGVAVDNARLFTETAMEREKLSLILSNIADIVIVVSGDNHILLINQSAVAALRIYIADDYSGRRFNDVIEHQQLREFFQQAVESKQGLIEELQLPNNRFYHAYITPQEGIGWIIVMQDITPFKEMDKLKSELLATASHDLKQPLSVMRGYLDLLKMTNNFDEKSQRFVESITRAIKNMQVLIDELLDLAKIESGIELNFERVNLSKVLQESVEAIKPKAEEKSLDIITGIPDNLPPVLGDRFRISQIFNNIIGNAVKYTSPEGRVQITAETQGAMNRISVKDNGLGISPEDRAHIFDRFYRVRRPETDSIEGTGLGLAIVKSLIEAHKGKIDLESKLNHGSTFHVSLPID